MKLSDLAEGMKLEAKTGEKMIVSKLLLRMVHPHTLESTDHVLEVPPESFERFSEEVGFKAVTSWNSIALKGTEK